MDGKQAVVSVLMSVYNGEDWLKLAIDSVIAQTYPHWQFVIIDDNSNDATRQVLKAYENDKRFRIIYRDTQQGLTKNLNDGLRFTEGEYIARLDADDICMPERFSKQVAYLQSHPQTAVIGSFVDFIDEAGNPKGVWADDRNTRTYQEIKAVLPSRCCIAHPSVMMRKNIMLQYPYNEKQVHSQDWDLWLRMAGDGVIIEKINEALLKYRVHQRSVTVVSNKKSAFRKIDEVYRAYFDYVSKNKWNSFILKVRAYFILNKVKLFLSGIKKTFTS